jgi:hypothetical protein
MPACFNEIFIDAGCMLGAVVLGLPAVIRAIKLRKQGQSFPQDDAASDERFVG